MYWVQANGNESINAPHYWSAHWMIPLTKGQWCRKRSHIDGLVQERRNSTANALELRLSCTNPSISWRHYVFAIFLWILPGVPTLLLHTLWDAPQRPVAVRSRYLRAFRSRLLTRGGGPFLQMAGSKPPTQTWRSQVLYGRVWGNAGGYCILNGTIPAIFQWHIYKAARRGTGIGVKTPYNISDILYYRFV